MADYNTDGKHGLRALEGTSVVSEIDEGFAALRDDLDAIIATDDQGAFSSRPVSTPETPGKAGRYYWATDTLALYRDYGTGWTQVVTLASDGKLILGGDANLYRSAADVLKTDDKLHVVGEVEIDGALNHDGTHIGFRGATPVEAPAYVYPNTGGYDFDRSFSAHISSITTAELAKIVWSLIWDLQSMGLCTLDNP